MAWPGVGERLAALNWAPALPAPFLAALVYVLAAWRWQQFFLDQGLDRSLRSLLRPFFIGTWFNLVLPTSNGGDLVRMVYIYRDYGRADLAVSPVLTERLIGITMLFAMATGVLPFVTIHADWFAGIAGVLPLALAALLTALGLLGWPRSYRPVHDLLLRRNRFRLVGAMLRVAEAAHGYLGRPRLIARVALISFAMQFTDILVFWLLARAAGTELPLPAVMLAIPLVSIASALPISLGGLGVREGALVTLFVALGMPQPHAVSVAILYLPVLIAASLPGLFLFLSMRNHRALLAAAQAGELRT